MGAFSNAVHNLEGKVYEKELLSLWRQKLSKFVFQTLQTEIVCSKIPSAFLSSLAFSQLEHLFQKNKVVYSSHGVIEDQGQKY